MSQLPTAAVGHNASVRETPLSRAAKSLIKTLRDFAKKNYGEKKMV